MVKTGVFEDIPIYLLRFNENSCPFYVPSEGKCSIYDFRPTQCRNFPFLDSILSDNSQVEETLPECEILRMIMDTEEDFQSNSMILEMIQQERKMELDFYRDLKQNHMNLTEAIHRHRK